MFIGTDISHGTAHNISIIHHFNTFLFNFNELDFTINMNRSIKLSVATARYVIMGCTKNI